MDELELQDYLDGRLGEAEREVFEARVARDPELARRVEAYRRLGAALREAPAEMSPGLVSRARARFERSKRRRFLPRPLSWETAGLAAAALLLAAILLPQQRWWQRSIDPSEPPRSVAPSSSAAPTPSRPESGTPQPVPTGVESESTRAKSPPPDAARELAGRGTVAKAPDAPVDRQDTAQEQASRHEVVEREAAAEEPPSDESRKTVAWAPAPADREQVESVDRAAASRRGVGSEIARPDRSRDDRAAHRDTLLESAPDPEPPQAADRRGGRAETAATVPPATARVLDAPEGLALPAPGPAAGARTLAAGSPSPLESVPRRSALPPDGLAPGSVVVIDRADDARWQALLAGPAGETLSRLQPTFGRERVVLLGPRSDPHACAAARVEPSARGVRILLVAASRSAASLGCAIVIQADGGPVEIEESG